MKKITLVSVFSVSLFLTASSHGLDMQTVLVGDPVNPPSNLGGGNLYGSIAYEYEVTNDQYAEFLNAVAQTDTHFLYSDSMASNPVGGIERSGVDGSYSYTVKLNMGNKPVNYVGAYDTYRFANWLHNGMPSGSQELSTTEDGAYFLNSVTNPPYFDDENIATRKAGAKWFLPTDLEWFKAAYYQPEAQGGDADSYWLYPTRSNTKPTFATATTVGEISNPGVNVANLGTQSGWNGVSGNVTTVGSAGAFSSSYYGTFDQAGNVWELVETLARQDTGTNHFMRGGSFDRSAFPGVVSPFTGASTQWGIAFPETALLGFRVAMLVPEPSVISLVACLVVAAAGRPR